MAVTSKAIEIHASFSLEEMAGSLLEQTTGLDIMSPHGEGTAARFVAMLRELTTPEDFTFTTFPAPEGMDEMVIVSDIPFVSVCNHHVVPFIGTAHIAYVPDKEVAGLSKFARAVRFFAKQLQVQEELTMDIANFLEERLHPKGLGVVLKAEHLCMTIRGVQTPGTQTTTAAMKGVFADHTKTAKAEFLATVNK